MPDRDGDHICRIKSPLEEHKRVVKQSFSSNPTAVRSIQHGEVFMSEPDALNLHKEGQSLAVLRAARLKPTCRGIITAAALLLAVPLLIDGANAGGGRGGGVGGGF